MSAEPALVCRLSSPAFRSDAFVRKSSAESVESDSDLEEVDITESESDEEDPLADIL